MLFLIPWQTSATDITPEQQRTAAIQKAMKATVILKPNQTDSGSGFFIDKNLILTNFHVVMIYGWERVEITKSDGTVCYGNVKYFDEENDLALVKSDCSGEPLELADYVGLGQDVYVTGNPRSLSFIATSGIVSRVIDGSFKRIIADVNVQSGNSGSPMIDSEGNVVGVVDGRNKEAPYMAFAIHWKDVKEFLNKAGI